MANDRIRKRFWSKVNRSDSCWLWTKELSHDGYGRFWLNYRTIGAARAAWIITHGRLDDDQVVRHTCDNPPCVNPAHLLVGTPADNIRDKVERSRQAVGTRVNTAKLTERQVIEIRARYARGGVSAASLAAEYGVTPTPIWQIVTGKSWKHLLGNHAEWGYSDLELL